MESPDTILHALCLCRADREEEDVHAPVERLRVRHDTIEGCLHVEGRSAETAAGSAEPADGGEEIRVLEADGVRLHSAHGKPRQCAVVAIGDRPVGGIDIRNQVPGDHVLEDAEHPAEVGWPLTRSRRPGWWERFTGA